MSIANPNYAKLPSREAELKHQKRDAERLKRQAEAELLPDGDAEPDTLEMSKWSGRKLPPKRAICHPRRAAVNNELMCRHCIQNRLNRANKLEITPAQALAKQDQPGGVEKIGKETLAYMRENLPEYGRLHLEATRIAALKGDTKPSEWALTHIRTGEAAIVTPQAKEGGGGGGVKVVIGVQIGGLPPGVIQAEAITVPVEISASDRVPEDTK